MLPSVGAIKVQIVLPNMKRITGFPAKDLVTEMAKILDVNPLTLHEPTTMDASELMEILFWIDEFNPAAINLFQLETYPGKKMQFQ